MDELVTVKTKKKKWPFVLGVIILALAVVGAVSIGIKIADTVKENKNKSEDYTPYASYLRWVVGVDPDAFSDISKAKPADLLNIAMCTLLTDEVKTGQYNVTEDGMIVPAADVGEYFTKMFGTDVTVTHASVVGYGYEFKYNESAGTYTVPLTGVMPSFAPRIESLSRTGGLVYLRVGYVGTNNIEVGADGAIVAAQPDKYMDITLKETGDSFNLISVTAVTEGEY